jgi:alkaline phosphatase
MQENSGAISIVAAAASTGSQDAHNRSREASFAAGGQPDRTLEARGALHGGKAKNVIFFPGDGMGDSEVTYARY